MLNRKIAFVGCGNMASAIVTGLLQSGYPAYNLFVSNPSTERLQEFADAGVLVSPSNIEVVGLADIVILCVKPKIIQSVCEEIRDALQDGVLVVSIAAGLPTASIQQWLGATLPCVRAMPNTPAMVNAGATGLFATTEVSDEQRSDIESVFRSNGVVAWLDDEEQMPMVTAVSGSAPAYFFRFMESMEKKALALGLPHDMVKLFIIQTVLGAAKLAAESGDDFAALREAVTSPKGTTEFGLNVLNDADVDQLLSDVMDAVRDRAIALSKELT